jgi:hypothetical protein
VDENGVRSTTVHAQARAGENAVVGFAILRRSRSLTASTVSQPDQSLQTVSHIPRNFDVSIPYREEHGVVVLMPSNIDQCRDTPFLLSQAEVLGARETGLFRYVLPDDFQFNAQAVSSVTI